MMKFVAYIKIKKDLPFVQKGEILCVDEKGKTYRAIRDDFFVTPLHIKISQLINLRNQALFELLT